MPRAAHGQAACPADSFTNVVLKAALNRSRWPMPSTSTARIASAASATDTRTPAARAEGIRIAQEALAAVKQRVAGAYVMPPFNNTGSALAVLEVVRDRWKRA